MRSMTYEEYLNKVYGGWFGKCLGGAAGAPVEGVKGTVNATMREIMDPNIPNDDLDLQLLWLEILEKKGPYLTSYDLAKGWKEQCWYPFGEYGYFLKNFARGIYPPLSGVYNNEYFHEGMGCPIRSEIWAMINPGRPDEAVRLAKIDACLDHYDDSYWAEAFLAALESMAFFESDIEKLIVDAMNYVEEDCKFKRCVNMILQSYRDGLDIQTIIRKIQMDYAHPDFTNSIQNMGYTTLALLFGKNNMEDVINIALKCGYDTDCTCATAGAIVGIINGHDKFPDDLKNLLQDKFVCGIDVVRNDDRIITLAKDTCLVGLGMTQIYKDNNIEIEQPGLNIPSWNETKNPIAIEIEYLNRPSIGFNDQCDVMIKIKNNSTEETNGVIEINGKPAGWEISSIDKKVQIPGNSMVEFKISIKTMDTVTILNQTNIIKVGFCDENHLEIAKIDFGIAGALIWKTFGPYIEPREFVSNESVPPCHGPESALPVVETMFSNMALPDREYLDEKLLVKDADQIKPERTITAYEDLIPVDKSFGTYGEATFYLITDLWFEKELNTWIVIGNSDAFKIWINGELIQDFDEARTWQPQSHGSTVHFNEGSNRVILKLTRRAQNLKFSFGIRGLAEKHYHAQKWITDFACIK